MKKRLFAGLAAVVISAAFVATFLSTQSFADGECTNLINVSCDGADGSTILDLVKMVVNIMTGGIVIAGTIGIIWCGFLILSARDNEGQVAMAKKRLLDIVIGIVVFALGGLLVNLVLPTNNQSEIDGWFGGVIINNSGEKR